MARYSYTIEEFEKAVRENHSISGVLRTLGIKACGGNYYTFKKLVEENGIDTSHFKGQGYLKGETHDWSKKKPLEQIFTEDNWTRRAVVRNAILREGLIDYRCSSCGIAEWNGKSLSLHLDHINGVNNDHRLENLRFLCPNCHSQTNTYCGKNKKTQPKAPKPRILKSRPAKPKTPKPKRLCETCDKEVSRAASKCKSCAGKEQPTKIVWPDDHDLLTLVRETNFSAAARFLGVSDNAIRKRLKTKGLI